MKKNNYNNSGRSRKAAGKSYYIALFSCVAMIAIACYFAYSRATDRLTGQLNSITETTTATTEAEEVIGSKKNIEKNTTTATTVTTTPSETSASSTSQTEATTAKKKLIMPMSGEIITEFSKGELVKSPTTGAWQTHNGADIAATLGDEVRAIGDGVVSEVGNDALWGISISVDHQDGTVSRYCNLSPTTAVSVGDEIAAGTVIGTVGNTADIESLSPCHLHFEITKNGSYVDPITEISGE